MGNRSRSPRGLRCGTPRGRKELKSPCLCHDPRLRPVGVCRLCVVDVKDSRVLVPSCTRLAENGMEVETHTSRVEASRKTLLELLLADHPSPCGATETEKGCDLEKWGKHYGACENGFPVTSRDGHDGSNGHLIHDLSSKVIQVNLDACILCDRCIRGCDEIQSNDVIGRLGKGHLARIGFDHGLPMGDSTCVSCGECQVVCPTGALVNKNGAALRDDRHVDSLCPYCGVGCAVTYHIEENRVVEVTGKMESPVNQGRLCVKGRYGYDYAIHPQRLQVPLIRKESAYPKGPLSSEVAGKKGKKGKKPGGIVNYDEVLPAFREASWEEALEVGRSKASRHQGETRLKCAGRIRLSEVLERRGLSFPEAGAGGLRHQQCGSLHTAVPCLFGQRRCSRPSARARSPMFLPTP